MITQSYINGKNISMQQFIGNKCRCIHIDQVLTNGRSIMCHNCHVLGDDSPLNAVRCCVDCLWQVQYRAGSVNFKFKFENQGTGKRLTLGTGEQNSKSSTKRVHPICNNIFSNLSRFLTFFGLIMWFDE